MKINNKLFLITATLGIMAAGSITSFSKGTVYLVNNSPYSINCETNWANDSNKGEFDRVEGTSFTIAAGKTFSYEVRQNNSNNDTTNCSKGLHFKFKNPGNQPFDTNTAFGVTFHAFRDASTGDLHVHIVSAQLESGYNDLCFGFAITGANGTTTQENVAMQPIVPAGDDIDNTITITINQRNATSSPMGKLSSMLHNFKL